MARLIVVTVAILIPAMIARQGQRKLDSEQGLARGQPHRSAASSASGGTPRRPVRVLRNRISSV